MAEEKNQKPASTPEQPDLEAHSDDNKTENNETTEKITRYKKQAARSFVLAFTTLIAIIAVCIAWFVSNTKVTMTVTSISAENTVPFELASAGERQKPELSQGKLSEGSNENNYSNYIDYKTGTTYPLNGKTLYTGSSSLAWRLNGQQKFYPGASGELEFYFIPKQDGLKKITFQINLTGYKEGNGNNLSLVENHVWENLIQGHILIFTGLDANNTKGYSGWLGEINESSNELINELTINASDIKNSASDTAVFEKNMPYKVILYWKWPKEFRNYVYNDRTGKGDLFTDTSEADYKKLLKFVNAQVPANEAYGAKNTSKLFYSAKTYSSGFSGAENSIDINMSDEIFESCTNYYNLADEYIGKNAQYIYVELNAEQ